MEGGRGGTQQQLETGVCHAVLMHWQRLADVPAELFFVAKSVICLTGVMPPLTVVNCKWKAMPETMQASTFK